MSGVTVEAPSFSPELFAFLRELATNNDREWFTAHKARYVAEVQEPALAFIEDVGLRLPEVSRHLVADPRTVGGSMFRIHRDVRFSKDKSPYKTHVGIQFRHERARDAHAPGVYLHLEPGSVFMGCGTWRPDGDTLHAIRTAIASKPGRWQAIVEDRDRQPDRVRSHHERVPRPVPRPLQRGRRLHAVPLRQRSRTVLSRMERRA
jgi:uncharacterized protein (TIGR02453 family)